ncbi:MAG: EAL domain-containing protein, partial [Sulfuricellaceae bacterium]|nr:EAL domain-containing protein [Sulfuricellaceae bacterium]
MWLFLKYSGAYSAPGWEALGAQRLDGDVWRFRVATDEALKALVASLSAESERERMRDTYACLSADGSGELSSLEWLMKIQPFAVFSARCLHPWLNGTLDERVRIHFQPVADLAQDGRVVGYEALCRFAAPGGALLSGKEAFALAVAAQRAADLDKLCQNRALQRAARELGGTLLFLKVLPQNLLYAEWRQSLLDSIKQYGLEPGGVVIEVVDCERMEPAALAVICEELRREGLRVALDDIGSGCTGLTVMAAVRADFVKINRTLIHEAQGSQVRAALVEALVSMSQRLGAVTIGKGLERGEDVSFCRELGIMWAQGYYFAAPREEPPAVICGLPGADDLGRFRPASRFRLDQLVDPVLAIDIREPYAAARKLFEENTQLPLLVVVDDGRPVGLLKRGQVFSRSGVSIGKACIPIQRIIPQRLHDKAISRFLYLERLNDVPWVV